MLRTSFLPQRQEYPTLEPFWAVMNPLGKLILFIRVIKKTVRR